MRLPSVYMDMEYDKQKIHLEINETNETHTNMQIRETCSVSVDTLWRILNTN